MMTEEHSCAVILLNWRRPANLAQIVGQVIQALPQAGVFLIDQAETQNRVAGSADIPWHAIWYRAQDNKGPGVRIDLAAELSYDHFLCIDDDVFLNPAQIRGLLCELHRDPMRAHGIAGQMAHVCDDTIYFSGPKTGSHQVSILNWVYAFTRQQAREASNLASMLGFNCNAEILPGSDIVLSCAGQAAPLIHDLGQVRLCPTCDDPNIAVWRQKEFYQERGQLISRLWRLRRFHASIVEPAEIGKLYPPRTPMGPG